MANEWKRIYEPALRVNPLQEALKAHTEDSALWRYWDEWEYIVEQYELVSADFRGWVNRKTEMPEISLVVNQDDLSKIQKWLLGNVLRLASGEPYSGLSVVKVKTRQELQDLNGTVVAQAEEGGEVLYQRLVGILKEAQELDLLNELQETMKEVKEKQDKLLEISIKIVSELEILGMKRAFPGSCRLCPI